MISVVTFATTSWLQYTREKAELQNKLVTLSQTYSLLLAEPMATEGEVAVQSFLTALLSDRDIGYLCVLRLDGTEVISVGQRSEIAPAFFRAMSIRYASASGIETVGRLEMGVSLRHLHRHIQFDILTQLGVLLVLLLGIAAYSRLVFNRVVGVPLRELLRAIDGFERDKTPHELKMGHGAEFDRVARATNDMQKSLAALRDRLEMALSSKTEQLGTAIEGQSRATQALRAAREFANVTLNSLSEAVITTDRSGNINFFNKAAERLLSVSPPVALGLPLSGAVKFVDSRSTPAETLIKLLVDRDLESTRTLDAVIVDAAGSRMIVEIRASRLGNWSEYEAGISFVIHDVTESRKLQERLSFEATHDPLTGLLNRRAFDKLLSSVAADEELSAKPASICFLDLDHFKAVNDAAGHAAGDTLLQRASMEIRNSVREDDQIARLGGDEFALLLCDSDTSDAKVLCEEIVDRLSKLEFIWQQHVFKIGCSVGIASAAPNSSEWPELSNKADLACYVAKLDGRNRVHIHSDENPKASSYVGDVRWVTELDRILGQDGIEIWGQRISAIGDEVFSENRDWYEVLVRVRDSSGKLHTPDEFVRAAERYDKIGDLDVRVVEATLAWMASELDRCGVTPKCSINLSGKTICNDRISERILKAIRQSSVDPALICFEITETEFISSFDHATALLEGFRELGCSCALDDFGSGVCSFAYLRNLKVDYLKIDGQFVQSMARDQVDRELVDSISSIGHIMGLKTIAEYVEDEATLDLLKKMKINYVQGFLMHRPEPLVAANAEANVASD